MSSPRKYSSCPPALNSCNKLLDPLSLTMKELEKISRDDDADMERIENYKSGGFMPIYIGQEIGDNKQYKIIRKLGWGSFSTVWLCTDKLQKSQSYYAIKIAKSSKASKRAASCEIDVLEHIKAKYPNYVGYNRFVWYYTHFVEGSIYGTHICLKYETMGPSLLDLLNLSNCKGLDQHGVKLIIKQICEGLFYLHKRCKVIHTDIKPQNILICTGSWYFNNMDAYVRQFSEHGVTMPKSYMSSVEWGKCKKSDDSETKSKESSLYKPVLRDDCQLVRPSKKIQPYQLFVNPNTQIKISDFGCAILENKPHPLITQPNVYRALEVIIQAPYSFPIDMWSVGCLTYELSTGKSLFGATRAPGFSSNQWKLFLIWRVFGEIPKDIACSGRKSWQFFNSEGKLKNAPMNLMKNKTIQHKLVRQYGWKLNDALIFEDFVKSLIDPDPTLRATASTVNNKTWLKELIPRN